MKTLPADPFLVERTLRVLAGSDVPMSRHTVAAMVGVYVDSLAAPTAQLLDEGLIERTETGYLRATDLGRKRATEVLVASLDSEMDIAGALREGREAVVAAAAEALDDANRTKLLAIIGRSSRPMSVQRAAVTIGEDPDTVDDLVGALITDGLLERTPTGALAPTAEGKRRAEAMGDAEVQALFASARDALVADAGATMSVDVDVAMMRAEYVENGRRRARRGLVASFYGSQSGVARTYTREERALHRALRASRAAMAAYTASRSEAGDRPGLTAEQRAYALAAIEATYAVQAAMAAVAEAGPAQR